jgi:hypothetical protein
MVLRRATSLRGALEGVGPENRDFLSPEMATGDTIAIWAQKSRGTEVHNLCISLCTSTP